MKKKHPVSLLFATHHQHQNHHDCDDSYDDQEVDEDGALIHDPVQECNDLINNRGCVKQYVNKGGNTNNNKKKIKKTISQASKLR